MIWSKFSVGGGGTPLHLATKARARDVVQLLLVRGADPNMADGIGWTPLHYAAIYSQDALRLLLDKGADPNKENENGMTPLHLAAEEWEHIYGGKDVVQLLLEGGADPNKRDGDGKNPLQRARRNRCISVVELLYKAMKK